MTIDQRLAAFKRLGELLHTIEPAEKKDLVDHAGQCNPWFTPAQIDLALQGIGRMLNANDLERWASAYSFKKASRTVGVVMAGNIPLVGFHDLLTVMISGHHLAARASSQDLVLMKYVIDALIGIEPGFTERVTLRERLNGVEAVIATGSDNTARYFEYYFRNIPHIIRKNRSSCAVLTGKESDEELTSLGKDVFSYYGRGCRNVSKLFVPEGYDFPRLLGLWETYSDVIQHHKYSHNYDYNKSILLVNQTPHFDNGFALITESQSIVSPISTVYFESYGSMNDVVSLISRSADSIQCVAGNTDQVPGVIPFGETQFPQVWDYADGVDTMAFLADLN